MPDFTEQEPQRTAPPPFIPFVPAEGMPQQLSPEEEQFTEEQEQPEERPESEKRIRFIGESSFPGAEKHSDGISDLFEVDVDQITDDVDELVDVDFDRDILDANENGDLEDMVNVSNEDIIGVAPKPRQRRIQPRPRRINRYQPPTSAGGMRG